MLSDNGLEFVGEPFEEMLRDWGKEHVKTTPYMFSSKGLAERTVRTLCEMLRVMCTRENEGDLWVGKVLWAFNATVHSATGELPCNYIMNFKKVI